MEPNRNEESQAPSSKNRHIPTSQVLEGVAKRCDAGITIQQLAHDMAGMAFGICVLIFALPNIVPIPLPGLSTLTAMPILYFSVQLMLGRRALWLPPKVAGHTLKGESVKRIIEYAVPWLVRFERYFKPRMHKLAAKEMRRVTGGVITFLALLIALPIPFGNWVPALAIIILCLGLIEHDGMLMLLGWITGLLSIVYLYFLVSAYFWVIAKTIEAATGVVLLDSPPPSGAGAQ